MRHKLGNNNCQIDLGMGGASVSSREAAEIFASEFSSNFSSTVCVDKALYTPYLEQSKPILSLLNSTEFLVMEALKSCNNSLSSHDGISFKLLIIRSLNIIYQKSLNQGIFPRIWKHAVVIPLYKGRDGRSCVSSYRPVSLCSCLGKVTEKIVHTQLLSFLHGNELLYCGQHYFTPGKSTLTNMLTIDACIANCQLLKHPCDIMSFDFKKAFEKVPHQKVISELAVKGITGRSLEWFSSFLSARTQQVRVGIHMSSIKEFTFGVVEGSVLGPDLYNVSS